jgi:hypothetical protein
MSVSQMKRTVGLLCVAAGLVLSGAANAEPSKFDGTWKVALTTNGGPICGSLGSLTLTARNGSVSGGGSGVSVSGQVTPSGSVSLGMRRGFIQGSGSGHLSEASGSGTWTTPVGCSGRWTAQR